MSEPSGIRGHIIIIIQTLMLPATCVITYFVARHYDHVEARFPYISDSGAYSPESCIFGFLLAVYALGTFLCIFMRWRIVCDDDGDRKGIKVTNHISLALGIISSIGILVVATFQVTAVNEVHYLGAVMAFGVGSIYMIIHGILTFLLPSIPGYNKCLSIFRLDIAILAGLTALASGILGWIVDLVAEEPDDGKWDSSMEGYEIHLGSTSCEWACAGLVAIYFATLAAEFRHIRVGMPLVFRAKVEGTGETP